MRCHSIALTCLVALLVLTSAGCPQPGPVEFHVAPGAIEIPLGAEHALTVTSTDPGDKRVECIPDDPLVARADSRGVVRALGLGHTELKVTGWHSREQATVAVNVVAPAGFAMDLPQDPSLLEPAMDKTATDSQVECILHFPGVAASIEKDQQTLYHRIHLMGAERTRVIGWPELPVYTLHVAIPRDSQSKALAQWSVTIARSMERAYENVVVYPAQPAAWIENEKDNYRRPALERDKKVYSSGFVCPGWDYQTETYQLGNLDVLEIRVSPCNYIPSAKRLILARELHVQVDFTGVSSPTIPYVLGDFKGIQEIGAEEWLAEQMLNRDRVPVVEANDLSTALAAIDPVNIHDNPFELLIITRPGLFGQARRLARWRQDTGTRVYLASLSNSTYSDAESIRDFIRSLDEANILWTFVGPGPRAMSAILLFGDAEIVPPHQGMNYRGQADPTGLCNYVLTVNTDSPYSAIRGDDDEPDVAIGRISVDSTEEAEAIVDKIIAYEDRSPAELPNHAATYAYLDDVVQPVAWLLTRLTFTQGSPVVYGAGAGFIGNVLPGDAIIVATSPIENPPWYHVAEVVSDSELVLTRPYQEIPNVTGDYGGVGRQDGRDDWEFLGGAERVRRFLSDRGATVRFGYTRNEGPDPLLDFHGDPLPPELLAYTWDAGPEDIQAHWRQGLDGIIVHCDHGLRSGWHHPHFETRDPDAADPGHMIPMDDPATAFYPIVFSMNCDSGWFDNETDKVRFSWGLVDIPQTGPRNESFCERVLRFPEGGAVAVVGAIRGSDADANDRLLDGLMAALYPDYAEGSISPWRVRPAFDRLGPAFQWAMFHQKFWLGADESRVQYNREIFHLHGDPMLKVRLPEP